MMRNIAKSFSKDGWKQTNEVFTGNDQKNISK